MLDLTPPVSVSVNEWAIIQGILEAHIPEREVWAFGSRVKGHVKAYSDLDIAVMGESPLSTGTVADLKQAFSDSDLPFKVDLALWSDTSENFRQLIANSHVVIRLAKAA